MANTLKKLCEQYGYMDSDTEQVGILSHCLDAAIQYAFNADLRPPDPGEADPLYDLLLMQLATHWYDNRGAVVIGAAPSGQIALGVDAIIVQHGENRRPGDTLAAALEYARGRSGDA